MTQTVQRRAPAALAVSGLVLAELIAVRALFRADRSSVSFLGEPFGLSCGFNQHFHVPCPGCGFTRGIVLALQGDISGAYALFPAAPLLLLGSIALVLGLGIFAACELYGARMPRASRWVRVGGLAYVALVVLVWAVGYGTRLTEVTKMASTSQLNLETPR